MLQHHTADKARHHKAPYGAALLSYTSTELEAGSAFFCTQESVVGINWCNGNGIKYDIYSGWYLVSYEIVRTAKHAP